MAIKIAQNSGNWSDIATWGGSIPAAGDTVYANGKNITIDQSVDLTGSSVVTSGSFIAGQIYEIVSLGNTNWTLTANCILPGSNAGTATAISASVGTQFQAVNAGTATTGTARLVGAFCNYINTPISVATGGSFSSNGFNITGVAVVAGTATCLTCTGNITLSNCVAHTSWTTNAAAIANTGTGIITFSTPIIFASRSASATAVTNNSTGEIIVNSPVIGWRTTASYQSAFENNGVSPSKITCNTANLIAGPNGSNPTFRNASTGTVELNNCNITGASAGGNNSAIHNSSTGSILINGGTINGGSAVTQPAIWNTQVGSLFIDGAIITGGSNSTAYAIHNVSTGPTQIINSTINASTAIAVFNASTGDITVTNSAITAINGVVGLHSPSTTGNAVISGSFNCSVNGTWPLNCSRFRMGSAPLNARTRYALNGSTTYTDMFTADNSLGQANPTDVRSGVSYASGNLTGRLTVPARGSVALSVNYGPSMPFTATRSGTTATATLTYSYPLVVGDSITVTGASNSEWNSTYTIASVVSGTSVTFVVPNTHSATAGTGATMQTTGTAVLDPAAVASAVWGAATRTITGGTVDTATTLTNAPTVPSVVQIRQEMDTNSTKLANLDATVSSRLATSGYTAPSNSDVTAIKAKTDLLETTRLAQCSTVATTGDQIAAAFNSP